MGEAGCHSPGVGSITFDCPSPTGEWLCPLTWSDVRRAAAFVASAFMLGLLIALCAIFGLAIGSFLNVVIYRVPRDESIISPRSACPSCGTPILERDNIPVLSWLLLKGRCRT